MDHLQPSRVPAAFAAAGASTLLVLIVMVGVDAMFNLGTVSSVLEAAQFLSFVFVVALFHALGIGLPAHRLVPRRWRYSLRAIAPGSFLVGAVPMPLPLLLLTGSDFDGDSPEALATWLALAGALGAIGLAGGIAFWLMVRGWAEEDG